MDSFSNLPLEIYFLILRYIDKTEAVQSALSLLNLAKASRSHYKIVTAWTLDHVDNKTLDLLHVLEKGFFRKY
jgi:hypothetical protein